MAAVQTSQVGSSIPFYVGGGTPLVKDQETILTDGSRTVPLAFGTIMAQIASTKTWVPWINANLGDTTGMQYPLGILVADGGYTATQYAAGDITGAPILIGGGVKLDFNQLVFDKGSTGVATANTLDSVPTVPTNLALRAEIILKMNDIYIQQTVTEDLPEN